MLKETFPRMRMKLGAYKPFIEERLRELEKNNFIMRLWAKDPSLWKTEPNEQEIISQSLGWLESTERMQGKIEEINQFAQEITKEGFQQVVHMGMGGSSLAPLTFKEVFSKEAKGLPLVVLDTTDPASISKIEKKSSLAHTLFIIASKSGTTTEPLAFGEYFYSRLKEIKGERAGENFAVITDPGTYLEKLAQERQFRKVFPGFSDVGGRYSALSPFGLVPASLIGLPLEEILKRAGEEAKASSAQINICQNEGVILGTVVGELAWRGRDKLTFILPTPIATLGLWLEQLLAESTGKEGRGILPVDDEPLALGQGYEEDRIFVFYFLGKESGNLPIDFLAEIDKVGHPIIIIEMNDYFDLFAELFRWEIATATAGAILKINPFDQPNVQESKKNTNSLLEQIMKEGKLPSSKPALKENSLEFYGTWSGENAQKLLQNFFASRQPGDYFSLLAFLPEETKIKEALQLMRRLVRNNLHIATTLGFGPRYLHSTGQFHKGGPNKGLFIMLTAEDKEDIPIPYQAYSFGTLKMAQALGDFEALRRHGRRILRVHLGTQIVEDLEALVGIIKKALS